MRVDNESHYDKFFCLILPSALKQHTMAQVADEALADYFVGLAEEFIHGLGGSVAEGTLMRRFTSHFGISPRLCALVWQNLLEYRPPAIFFGLCHVHLLWTLNLLKADDMEHCLNG